MNSILEIILQTCCLSIWGNKWINGRLSPRIISHTWVFCEMFSKDNNSMFDTFLLPQSVKKDTLNWRDRSVPQMSHICDVNYISHQRAWNSLLQRSNKAVITIGEPKIMRKGERIILCSIFSQIPWVKSTWWMLTFSSFFEEKVLIWYWGRFLLSSHNDFILFRKNV